jgi:HSP20 family protein
MAKQEPTRSAAILRWPGEERQETSQSDRSRPIRLVDPFAIWYQPPSLLGGISPGIVSDYLTRSRRASWSPVLELAYRDNNLEIIAELPGLGIEDIKVEVIGNVLTIQGERRPYPDVERRRWRTERKYGYFYRELVLPEGADLDHVRAEFDNGILRITVPMTTSMRQVPIETTRRS